MMLPSLKKNNPELPGRPCLKSKDLQRSGNLCSSIEELDGTNSNVITIGMFLVTFRAVGMKYNNPSTLYEWDKVEKWRV